MSPITSRPKVAVLLSCLLFALAGCDGGGGGGGNNNDNDTGDRSNTAPVAKASGPDSAVAVGATVQLDGGGSRDADGDSLRYRWTLLQRPANSNATLAGADAVKTRFTLDKPGDYVVQLIVNDGQANSAPDSVAVATQNARPVANAGQDQATQLGDAVQLDGGKSKDPDGNTLTYKWSWLKKPNGSSAALIGADSVKPGFTVDAPGDYEIQLIVNDGQLDSAPDKVAVSTENVKPVANAGADQAVNVGATAQLDGSRSADANGDQLSYKWSLLTKPNGSSAALIGVGSVKPGFVADAPGDYEIQLIVNDGQVDSAPDTVIVSTDNVKPVANAGADQSVDVGATAQLNGGGSTDADGDSLTYRWTWSNKPSGSAATLAGADSATPSFVVDAPGSYEAQLIVNDGQIDSDPASVVISTNNIKPVANAGANRTARVGAAVQLNGAGSTDADEDSLTYHWSLIAKPTGSAAVLLGDNGAVNPGFVIDKPGDYVAQLIVNDGQVGSDPATVTISTQNTAPVARAGLSQPLPKVNVAIELDGSASNDVDDDPLTYRWSWLSRPTGSNAALLGVDSVNPGFVADVPGPYIAQLIVNDGQVDSAPATVTITTDNLKPIADAGFPQTTVTVGSTAQLNGANSSDPENQPLTYRWSLLSKPDGSAATLQGADTETPTFVVDVAGDYVAQLIVNDGVQNSDPPATVLITRTNLPPIANAGPDQTVENINPPAEKQLDGGLSSDPNNDPLTYRWSLLSKPDGSQATLVNPTTPTPTLRSIDRKGRYVAQLTVNDGYRDSDPPDTVVVVAPEPLALGMALRTVALGKNLQTSRQILLEAPAPDTGTVVTLTSADPTKIKLSNDPKQMGSGVLTVIVSAGQSFSPPFYFQGFADNGSVTVTATADGYPAGDIIANLLRSGFVIYNAPYSTPANGPNFNIVVQSQMLDANNRPTGTLQPVGPQYAAAPVSVRLSNTNNAVGRLLQNQLNFTAGVSYLGATFDPLSAGATTVSIDPPPPADFYAPTLSQSVQITVTPPSSP